MGKLLQMPHVDIIRNLKGLVDFYTSRGIVCFRAWPKKGKVTMPGQIARNKIFAQAVAAFNLLTDAERDYWRKEGSRLGLNLRDAFMSHYLKTHS